MPNESQPFGLDVDKVLSNGLNGKRANISIDLKDLNYSNFEDNSNNFMHRFDCSGVISEQSLQINSAGYLNGSVTIRQLLR